MDTIGDFKESRNIAFKKAIRMSSFPLVPNNCLKAKSIRKFTNC
ncbi:hypothetical protein BAPAT_1044 [Bacillus anthracis str. SVA11]|nr:Hypothetical Protein H9401_1041 [Bacillus anthracis str. H9401]AHK37218.1 hypothetical protein BAPAT_1044 [Bacillus anthracis str. SVA11]